MKSMKNIKNVMLLVFCLSLTVPMSTVYANCLSGVTNTATKAADDTASGATEAADDTASAAEDGADYCTDDVNNAADCGEAAAAGGEVATEAA